MWHILGECEEAFGSAPRRTPFWDSLTYLRIGKPRWLRTKPDDQLNVLFDNLKDLYRNGVIVWGHIVQANVLMFEDGDFDCPAALVYSLADSETVSPSELEQVARDVYALKGTQPEDPQLVPIANYMTDEFSRFYGLPVPSVISSRIRCHVTTTMLVRKHLPAERLCASLMPIIVNPRPPFIALPLPGKYWPKDLIEHWNH